RSPRPRVARTAAARARAGGRAADRPARAARARGGAALPPRDRALRDRPGPRTVSLDLISQDVRQLRERRSRPRLHCTAGDAEELGDFAVREAAPVCERKALALALGQLLERAVDAPGDPALLGLVARPRVVGRLLGDVRRDLVARARPVDDRVACDRVQPGRTWPPV